MLGELAVFEADYIRGNPRRGTAVARKAPMCDQVVPFGEDYMIFVAECVGKTANKIEQAIAPRRNTRAVLDVPVRPEALRAGIIPLVEERVEGFQH